MDELPGNGKVAVAAGEDIQVAIDQVAAAGGGTVVLGAGVHAVNSVLVVPRNERSEQADSAA